LCAINYGINIFLKILISSNEAIYSKSNKNICKGMCLQGEINSI